MIISSHDQSVLTTHAWRLCATDHITDHQRSPVICPESICMGEEGGGGGNLLLQFYFSLVSKGFSVKTKVLGLYIV